MNRILVVGPEHHVKMISETLRQCNVEKTYTVVFHPRRNIFSIATLFLKQLSLSNYDILHVIFPSHKTTLNLIEKAVDKGVKVVLHWIGSDVLLAKKRNLFTKKAELFKRTISVTGSSWLAKELERYGIEVRNVIPILPADLLVEAHPLPLPSEFNVLFYLPRRREEIYNPHVILEVADLLEGKGNVIVIGGGKLPAKKSNIIEKGWVNRDEMKSLYSNITVLARYTKHDGMSLMILEALAYGRYVVFNKPFQYAFYVSNEKQLLNKIEELYEKFAEGKLSVNPVSNIIKEEFSPNRITKKLQETWGV